MGKNKKAPARAKAKMDYLLSTKLFCGECKAAMTGLSGTSSNKNKKYYYYQCVTNRRDKSCPKKSIGKEYIEDTVVIKLREFLTTENINTIAKEVVDLCERARNNDTLTRLNKLLKENEQATENLLKVLDNGQIADIIVDRISQKKKEHVELEQQKIMEEVKYPMLTNQEIRFFLSQFKKGDVNDPKYRQGLVDMLVNKIYLYDKKITVICNAQDSRFDIAIDEESLSNGRLVTHRGIEPLLPP